jgi:hypothetical protein
MMKTDYIGLILVPMFLRAFGEAEISGNVGFLKKSLMRVGLLY